MAENNKESTRPALGIVRSNSAFRQGLPMNPLSGETRMVLLPSGEQRYCSPVGFTAFTDLTRGVLW